MDTRRWLLLALSIATFTAGCGKPAELAVGTYNAGLATGYVPWASERAPQVASGLAAQALDVLCVQEVWSADDVARVKAATGDRYAQAVFLDPDPGSAAALEPACTGAELDPLQSCAETSCAGVPVDQLAGCVLDQCGVAFAAVSQTCSTCLAAHIGASFSEIRLTCTTGGSGAYAFGGSFGIGLLTSLPVTAQSHVVLDSTYNRRAVIHTRLDAGALGEVDVYCTHLSAIFSNIPYPGEGSWEAEQGAQIQAMHAFVSRTAGAGNPVLVLGDLNCGPAASGASAEAQANYQAALAPGYADPYATAAGATCTFCQDNPLVGASGTSVLIDHVLVRGGLKAVDSARMLTDQVSYPAGGETRQTPRSDHYGLKVVLQAK